MPSLADRPPEAVDVVVVGAGAAGIGAGRALQRKHPGLSLLVVEAGKHIGGRARTIRASTGHPIDLGCGWLHGARTNAWTGIAGDLGLTVDNTRAPWNGGGRRTGLSPDDQAQSQAALGAFFDRLETLGEAGTEGALDQALDPAGAWNGMIGAVVTYITGAEAPRSSIQDFHCYDPGPSPDWRVREGYGHAVAAYGAPLPVLLDTRVTAIDHGGPAIRLNTDRGTITTRAVIVAVSSAVLAAERIRFTPALPDKVAAAAALPLGLADKLFIAVENADDLPLDTSLLGSPHRTATGGYHLRPFGFPVIEGYYAGQCAADLEAAGTSGAFAFAAEELAGHLGHDIVKRLKPVVFSRWLAEPDIGGSYSYARPGCSRERERLAATVDGRLFFAGEACSVHRFSTAHGAYETGVAAAADLAATLPRV